MGLDRRATAIRWRGDGGVRAGLGLVVAAALAATGAASALANPPHITVPQGPSCTATALGAGLHRGFATMKDVRIVHPFGCSGDWAFAAVEGGRFEATALFHARSGRWVTVRRGPACRTHAVPNKIYRPACETN